MLIAALVTTLLWQPRDLHSTQISTAAMLAVYHPVSGDRTARLTITQGADSATGTYAARGDDYRIDLTLDGHGYAFGRNAGTRWRRTPAGTVRVVASDVQSDPLDRFPDAITGADPAYCTAAGEAMIDGASADVLLCRAPLDAPHWLYLDPATGTVRKEIAREGAHEMTYALTPAGWNVSGYGGDMTATFAPDTPRAVAASETAIPETTSAIFSTPPRVTSIPITLGFDDQIDLVVEANGKRENFLLDSGTTQILLSHDTARALGVTNHLGHGTIAELHAGASVARDLPVQIVPDMYGFDGLLGNEFFTGRIVHVDYAKRTLEIIDHASFVPPADAFAMAADFREGMPIVLARANDLVGERFALDTGSAAILLTAPFWQDAKAAQIGYGDRLTFLEGPVLTASGSLDALRVGPVLFQKPDVLIERPNAADLDIPLDGVIGTDALSHFEWWFDYDGGRIWLRRR